MTTTEERLRRHLSALGVVANDWEMEHLMVCDVCEVEGDWDSVHLSRCDVAQAHEDMEMALYRRANPIPWRQTSGGISLALADRVLTESYVPAMREMLERELVLNRVR